MIKGQNTAVDVLIVGGGMAGCALAYALAPKYRVFVLEKQPEALSQDRVGESLPAAAVGSLKMLGLDDALAQSSHSDYHGVVSIWGQSTPIRKDFFDTLDGSGLHVDRGSLNRAIKQAAIEVGVVFIHDAQLQTLCYDHGQWDVELNQHDAITNIKASMVIDASGRANVVARKLGLKRINADRAVAIHMQCAQTVNKSRSGLPNYQGTTLIESVENGWWYRAPLPNGKHVISFHTDSDLLITPKMQEPSYYSDALQATKLIAIGMDIPQGNDLYLSVCAANSSFPKQSAGEAWLAIGDAALAFDPLSSQGMFNALTTALLAKQCVHQALEGNANATAHYAQSISHVCSAYQRNLAAFYQTEMRWPESTFWQRRCA